VAQVDSRRLTDFAGLFAKKIKSLFQVSIDLRAMAVE
jgi:hypothetical protein